MNDADARCVGAAFDFDKETIEFVGPFGTENKIERILRNRCPKTKPFYFDLVKHEPGQIKDMLHRFLTENEHDSAKLVKMAKLFFDNMATYVNALAKHGGKR